MTRRASSAPACAWAVVALTPLMGACSLLLGMSDAAFIETVGDDAGSDASPRTAGHAPGPRDAGPGDAGVPSAPGASIACPHGVRDSGQCREIVPTGEVIDLDLRGADVSPLVLPTGEVLVNVDTGEIGGGAIRARNHAATTREVVSGIAYRQVNGVAIFAVARLVVPAGTTLKLFGRAAVALVSTGAITIDGIIDARPMDGTGAVCAPGTAGPGGYVGGAGGQGWAHGAAGSRGAGPGAGEAGDAHSDSPLIVVGGGGAGHAGVGGAGVSAAHPSVAPLAPGGAVYDPPPIARFRGGSGGGGGGGGAQSSSRGGRGGGGGGTLHLVAATSITIGGGASTAGINAGGCGGRAGAAAGGGGGGAGGAIRLEAMTLRMESNAVLAVNGGAGAVLETAGGDATLSDWPALGITPGSVGAANHKLAGGDPLDTDPGEQCPGTCGGGGAAGFIRIHTPSGTAFLAPGAIVSPSLLSKGTSFGLLEVR